MKNLQHSPYTVNSGGLTNISPSEKVGGSFLLRLDYYKPLLSAFNSSAEYFTTFGNEYSSSMTFISRSHFEVSRAFDETAAMTYVIGECVSLGDFNRPQDHIIVHEDH